MAEDCREASVTSLIIHDGVSGFLCGQLLALTAPLSSTLEPQLLSQENSKCLTLCGNHWKIFRGKRIAYTKAKRPFNSMRDHRYR